MNDWTDPQLLHAYAEGRSEAAFAELVRRHVDFVYSAALRMVCDPHLAEDVTQGVFVALANSAGPLASRPVLSGWLHHTAQNIAAQTVRTIERRRAREQEAAAMNELLSADTDATWEQIAPHLDAALGELSEPDRDALLLRYFERKSAHEMGQTLGVSDEAAQKRVSRAVERLREFFAKRGVTISASGLLVAISANAIQAAPVGLAVTISTAAALAGTTIATAATAAVTKAIAMTTLQKTLIATALVAAIGTGVYQSRHVARLRSQLTTLQRDQALHTEQLGQLSSERELMARELALMRGENLRLRRETAEVLKLRGEVALLRKSGMARLPGNAVNSGEIMNSLSTRIESMKKKLERTPTLGIPELQFTKQRDWIEAAGELKGDTEEELRKGLGRLRTLSKQRFALLMMRALQTYAAANNGELPSEVSQLRAHFGKNIDDSILERYKVVRTGNLRDLTPGESLAIEERAYVDDNYDTLFRIGPNGAGYRLATGPTGASSRQLGYIVSFDEDELRNGEPDADDEY